MKPVYIIDAIRTPIGKYAGALSSIRPDDLAALVISRLIERNASISSSEYDEVILGCANQAGEDNRNVARMASLLAGTPGQRPGGDGQSTLCFRHERRRECCEQDPRRGW
jgi:acetyl-CoA acyltransferase